MGKIVHDRSGTPIERNNINESSNWIRLSKHRRGVLECLRQPMTTKQISKQTGIETDSCSQTLWDLRDCDFIYCCNRDARRSRLYWLTDLGKACQNILLERKGKSLLNRDFPQVDWELYGWVCYSHRAAIIKAMTDPLQPSAIKRKAGRMTPGLTMSANNVRDVIKLFLKKGIVRPVKMRRKAHTRYELTRLGRDLQRLLNNVE